MTGNQQRNSNNSEVLSWVLTIMMLVLFWPVGLFLLLRKLSAGERKGRTVCRPAPPVQEPGTQGVYPAGQGRTVRRRDSVQSAPAGRTVKRRTPVQQEQLRLNRGRNLMIGGGVLAGFSGFCVLSAVIEMVECISWGGSPFWYLEDVFFALGFCCVGLVLLYVGNRRNKKARRFRKYLALIGPQSDIAVETLAQAMPVPVRVACDDLQEMLDEGVLPSGYLDMSSGRLILGSEGLQEPPKPEPEPVPEEPADEDDRILAQIRAVNDAIEDPVMSGKIDRIEEITRKIFAYQKKNPEKGGQLRSFLNYYLPTTLKILNSYAQLEEQGVEGANISAAKERIEGMMDKVVEGFEKQLDKLFENTAMDITTDVKVLEQMLEKDGLSQNGSGLTLGG